MSSGGCWMRGERFMAKSWLDALKIAICNRDTRSAYRLIAHIPDEFANLDDLLEAKELILQGIELLQKEREALGWQMQQLKLAKKFLQS